MFPANFSNMFQTLYSKSFMFVTQKSLMPINQKVFHVPYSKMPYGHDLKILQGQYSQRFHAH